MKYILDELEVTGLADPVCRCMYAKLVSTASIYPKGYARHRDRSYTSLIWHFLSRILDLASLKVSPSINASRYERAKHRLASLTVIIDQRLTECRKTVRRKMTEW